MRFFLVFAPMVLIAILGGNYVAACLDALAAPGVPIQAKYQAQSGQEVALWAESYVFDWRKGNLRVTRPRLVASDRTTVAQLDHLALSGLNVLWGTDQIIDAQAHNLQARLVRLKSGRFEFQDLLPTRSEKPSQTPFRFRLDEAKVAVRDEAGATPWKQAVLVTDLDVQGLGDDWVATAGAFAPGIGAATGRLQNISGKGLSLSGRTEGLQLKSVVDHLRTSPERKSLGDLNRAFFSSLRVTGPFVVYVPVQGEATIESQVKAVARDLRYERIHADLASFEGLMTLKGAAGKLAVEEGPNQGVFNGTLSWSQGYRLGGQVRLRTPNIKALPMWVREVLPQTVSFQEGVYDGWVTVKDGTAILDGNLSADWLRVASEEIRNPLVRIHLDRERTQLRLLKGDYLGRAASGMLVYDFASRSVVGAVSSTHTSLQPLVDRFPQLRGLSGEATLSVSIGGSTTAPILDFEARGSAIYRKQGWQPIIIDRFDLTGVYRNGRVAISRGLLQGPIGLVTAVGNVTETGRLDLTVTGRDLSLSTIRSDFSGSANLSARVGGTIDNPLARGRLEVYNAEVQGQGLTAASTNFTADLRGAMLTNLNAYRGAANVTGQVRYRFANQGIEGRLQARNLQLEDFLGPDYVGSLSAPTLVVGGTIDRPIVRGTVDMRDAVVQGIKIEGANASASLTGSMVSLAGGQVNIAGGTVAVDGTFDTKTRSGRLAVTGSGLEISRLAPEVAKYATILGSVNGTATLEVVGAEVRSATGKGRIEGVEVNETPMGDGPWDLAFDGRAVTGNVFVGFLERYITLSDLSYTLGTASIEGQADFFNIRVQDLVGALLPSLPRMAFETEQRLRAVTGNVNIASTFSGTVDDPHLNVESLEASELAYRKTDFGTLTASFRWDERRWDVHSLNLAGPVGNVQMSGSAAEQGSIALTGTLSGLDLGELSVVDARLASLGGQVSVDFQVTGQTSSPEIQASIIGNRLLARSAETPEDQTLRVLINTLTLSEREGLQADGVYFYRGFQGTVSASAPVRYPFALAETGDIETRITLANRSLKEIASLFPGLDADETVGSVKGEILGSGTVENFVLNGEVSLSAEKIAFEPRKEKGEKIDTVLTDVEAAIQIGENKVQVLAGGSSSRGGTFKLTADTNIEDFRQLAEKLSEGANRTVFDNAVRGELLLEAFHIREAFEGNSYVDTLIDGTVGIGGRLNKPHISGTLSASSLDTVLPFFEASNEPGQELLLNPTLDLKFALADAARIRTVTADLNVLGDGSLNGSLAEPNLNATMIVDRGSIRFPASAVRLDPGGQIDLRYRVSAGEPFASLEVDLQGHTALTALRYDDVPERYEILMELRGDLLKEGGLDLVATSDPPDLSQERILTLLGSVDLLTSFISSDQRYGTEERFRGALIGYALPVVFDPFTSRIAAALGLEYLNLEYNQYEQATIAFAKALTPEFILQGRRQVSEPAPGFKQQYDLRLVYRPRRVKGFFRRFSLSVGTDQDRPWKIAFEYGTRF